MIDYSQHGEQEIILDYFKGEREGTLLSIGENDGETFSNARALLDLGWAGDLVEPSFRAFEKLYSHHGDSDKVYLHNVAIWDREGELDFFESGSLVNGSDIALVSSLKETETHRWKKAVKPEHKIVEYVKTKVPTITWQTFLKYSQFKKYDFITMDVEGCELDILKQMDIEALGVKMICVEYNGKDQEKYDAIIPLPRYWKNRTNLIYAKVQRKIIV
jgi:FkbM family methyltransferase